MIAKIKVIFLFTFLSLAFVISCYAQNDIRAEIEKLIYHETNWDKINPSACVIALIEEDTIYYFSFDYSKYYNLDEHSIFEIGSATKLFTSLFLEDQIEKGTINDSDKVASLLNQEWVSNDLSIYDLKNHLTGLPKRPKFWGKDQTDADQPYLDYSNAKLLDYLKNVQISSRFSYSHINYALFEPVLSEALGINYTKTFNQFLKDDLKMKNSWVYNKQENTLVQGIDRSGIFVDPYIFNSFLSSEGMRSSCYDIATFAQQLLKEQTKLIASENSERNEYAKDIDFQYPWFKLKIQKSKDIYSYAGRTEGHNIQLFLYPETNTGVVLMANGSKGVPYLALNILRMMNRQWKRKSEVDNKN